MCTMTISPCNSRDFFDLNDERFQIVKNKQTEMQQDINFVLIF